MSPPCKPRLTRVSRLIARRLCAWAYDAAEMAAVAVFLAGVAALAIAGGA